MSKYKYLYTYYPLDEIDSSYYKDDFAGRNFLDGRRAFARRDFISPLYISGPTLGGNVNLISRKSSFDVVSGSLNKISKFFDASTSGSSTSGGMSLNPASKDISSDNSIYNHSDTEFDKNDMINSTYTVKLNSFSDGVDALDVIDNYLEDLNYYKLIFFLSNLNVLRGTTTVNHPLVYEYTDSKSIITVESNNDANIAFAKLNREGSAGIADDIRVINYSALTDNRLINEQSRSSVSLASSVFAIFNNWETYSSFMYNNGGNISFSLLSLLFTLALSYWTINMKSLIGKGTFVNSFAEMIGNGSEVYLYKEVFTDITGDNPVKREIFLGRVTNFQYNTMTEYRDFIEYILDVQMKKNSLEYNYSFTAIGYSLYKDTNSNISKSDVVLEKVSNADVNNTSSISYYLIIKPALSNVGLGEAAITL